MVWSALNKGKKTFWDFQPFFDTREEYVRNGGAILDDVEAIARYPPVINLAQKTVIAGSNEEDLVKEKLSHLEA